MRLLVISSAPIVQKDNQNYLYAPYEKEMQLWAKHVDTIQFCCPIWMEDRKLLITPISFEIEQTIALQEFDITSFANKLRAIPIAFIAILQIFKAMKQADHIHLRCPGNIALLASFVQILFPNKPKTAKYAGNWDPNSKQPWSYRLQKWILSTSFLTKNMQVLVYGEWEGSSKNVRPFFTATYSEDEMRVLGKGRRGDLEKGGIKFLFVGTLSKGKQPLYAVQLVEQLCKMGKNVTLDLYGEGEMRNEIITYIVANHLESIVTLQGNQSKEKVLDAYQQSHFLILPSKSKSGSHVLGLCSCSFSCFMRALHVR